MFGGRLNLIMSVIGSLEEREISGEKYDDVVGKIIINGEASTVS